jgi:hypothetical protein
VELAEQGRGEFRFAADDQSVHRCHKYRGLICTASDHIHVPPSGVFVMANRQTYPADALFPLRGDLSAEAGAVAVTVIGIQNTPTDKPVSPTDDLKVATYVDVDGRIEWKTPSGGVGAAVEINGVGVSSDKQVGINAVYDGSAPTWVFTINSVSDGG